LDQITARDGVIYRALPSTPWPGEASLEIAYVWFRNGRDWNGEHFLSEQNVRGITPFLTPVSSISGKPYSLAANRGKSFQGSNVLGMGFVLTPEEAQGLIARDLRNRDVLFPYLNGQDLNSRPDQSPSRWIINFNNWPLDHDSKPEHYEGPVASDYPDCLSILIAKVKDERLKLGVKKDSAAQGYAKYWWVYASRAKDLYAAIEGNKQVLIRARVANINSMVLVPTGTIFSETTIVFADDSYTFFSVAQSSFHTHWINQMASSLRTDVRYNPSDCFETFPLPFPVAMLEDIGKRYHEHRQAIMLQQKEGLTKTYNRFHDPSEKSANVERLRQLHVEMDRRVAEAYGWHDLDLGHDFHQMKQGLRFTISETARVEVLDRLLALNHERYEEEKKLGLHEKGQKKKAAKKRAKSLPAVSEGAPGGIRRQPDLFATSDQKELFED
jgi:hypothetical protein